MRVQWVAVAMALSITARTTAAQTFAGTVTVEQNRAVETMQSGTAAMCEERSKTFLLFMGLARAPRVMIELPSHGLRLGLSKPWPPESRYTAIVESSSIHAGVDTSHSVVVDIERIEGGKVYGSVGIDLSHATSNALQIMIVFSVADTRGKTATPCADLGRGKSAD